MTPSTLLSIYYRLRVVAIIKIYDPRCRARAIKCTIRVVPCDAIKRVAIYMDARVLHVTARPWGEKNGQRATEEGQDTCSPSSAPPPLPSFGSFLCGLFRKNPGQGHDLSSPRPSHKGTRCGTVYPDPTRRLYNATKNSLLPQTKISLRLFSSFSLTAGSLNFPTSPLCILFASLSLSLSLSFSQ